MVFQSIFLLFLAMPFPLPPSQPLWGFSADDGAILLGLCKAQSGRGSIICWPVTWGLVKRRIAFIKASIAPQFHIQNACSRVHLRVMQQIHWSDVWKYFSILIFLFFCARREYPKLQARNHTVQDLNSVQACYLLLRNVQVCEEEGWNFPITMGIRN